MAVAFVKQATASSGAASTSVTVTLGSAPALGNLLVLAIGGDKNTGTMATWAAANNWTIQHELLSTSVSLYYLWKVSDGTETSISPAWATASAVGNMAWYGEYQDAAVSGSTWQVSASASHITDEVTTTSWATGTTGTISTDGLALAAAAIDSSQSWTSATTWTNSYVSRYDGTGGGGRGGIFLSEVLVSAGGTTSSTFGYTGTVDQVSAAVAVFTKVAGASSGVAPSQPLLMTLNRIVGGRHIPLLTPVGGLVSAPASTATQYTQDLLTTSTGTTVIVVRVGKGLSATATGTGGLARMVGKILAATSTATATVKRDVAKVLSAASTAAASLVKRANKPLGATVTGTATLAALRLFLKALSVTATGTATIVKSVGKSLAATATGTPSFVKSVLKRLTVTITAAVSLLATKVILKTLSATATGTATVTRSVSKAISGIATGTGSFTRSVSKALAATATQTPLVVKQAGKRIAATSTGTAALAATRVFLKALVATATGTATVSRRIGKGIVATSTGVGAVTKRIATSMIATATGVVSLVGIVGADLFHGLVDFITGGSGRDDGKGSGSARGDGQGGGSGRDEGSGGGSGRAG